MEFWYKLLVPNSWTIWEDIECIGGTCGNGILNRERECEGTCDGECVGQSVDSNLCCFDFSECGKMINYNNIKIT